MIKTTHVEPQMRQPVRYKEAKLRKLPDAAKLQCLANYSRRLISSRRLTVSQLTALPSVCTCVPGIIYST